MSEAELAIPFPLDDDGFLRRECPTCEREFKWLPAQDETEATPAPAGGYFCPYCGVQAPPNAWHTTAQVRFMERAVQREVIAPGMDQFGRELRRIGQQTGGLIKITTQSNQPDELEPLTESQDMKRVDFGCHPTEPIKVIEDWHREVRCLMCGSAQDFPGT